MDLALASLAGLSSFLLAELVANQTLVGANDDVVWDKQTLKIGNGISLNVANGEITLEEPGTYELMASLRGLTFSNTSVGFVNISWVDESNNDINKSSAILAPITGTGANAPNPVANTIITVTVPTIVKLRVTNNTGTVTIVAITSRAIIKKLA